MKAPEKNLSTKRDIAESGEMQRAQTEVQAGFTIAINRPRDEARAIAKIQEAVTRPGFAESAFYVFPRGGKEIYGPSINFAREFARCWGNIFYGVRIIQDDEESRTIEGVAYDLETNVRVVAQDTFRKVILRKDKTTGQAYYKNIGEDERELRELTGRRGAILVRNCILQLAPRDVIDEPIEIARQTAKLQNQSADPTKLRGDIVAAFETIGVTREQLVNYCQREYGVSLDQLTGAEITALRGIYRSIEDGIVARSEIFQDVRNPAVHTPPVRPTVTSEDVQPKTPGPPPELSHAEIDALQNVEESEEQPDQSSEELILDPAKARREYERLLVLSQRKKTMLTKAGIPYHSMLEQVFAIKGTAEKVAKLREILQSAGIDVGPATR